MDFKNQKTEILVRVGFLVITIFIFVDSVNDSYFVLSQLFLFIILGLQIIYLIKFTQNSDKSILKVLESMDQDDVDEESSDPEFHKKIMALDHEQRIIFQNILKRRREQKEEFQYLRNIFLHAGIGLITFESSGKVQMVNTAAKKLLKINSIRKIQELKSLNPKIVEILLRLKTGGNDLVRLETEGEIIQLSVFVIELTLRGKEYKLVSLQDIQNELEEKEMEAWQNLVRVLTHEIMNSLTPITSLATTIEGELNPESNNDEEKLIFKKDDVEDMMLAAGTIKKRSKGLIRFIQDFRNLTHVSTPKISEVLIKDIFNEIAVLLKNDMEKQKVSLECNIQNEDMILKIDKEMISQVLINLVKNAIEAFEEDREKPGIIELKAYLGQKDQTVISVKDNGPGIDEDAVSRIFIPFYTTKKSGSGIGLSLSRQIVRLHKATLSVKSEVGVGTEFFLRF